MLLAHLRGSCNGQGVCCLPKRNGTSLTGCQDQVLLKRINFCCLSASFLIDLAIWNSCTPCHICQGRLGCCLCRLPPSLLLWAVGGFLLPDHMESPGLVCSAYLWVPSTLQSKVSMAVFFSSLSSSCCWRHYKAWCITVATPRQSPTQGCQLEWSPPRAVSWRLEHCKYCWALALSAWILGVPAAPKSRRGPGQGADFPCGHGWARPGGGTGRCDGLYWS